MGAMDGPRGACREVERGALGRAGGAGLGSLAALAGAPAHLSPFWQPGKQNPQPACLFYVLD